jgi:uncharacterized protein YjiS (DUF1127 family)
MLYSPPPAGPFRAARTASLNVVRVLVSRLAVLRRTHAQRIALRDLMQLDAALLDDLGIDRMDIIDALARPGGEAARVLERRRARNAERPPVRR